MNSYIREKYRNLFNFFPIRNSYSDIRFDCFWINGVSIMWMILSLMKRLMTSKRPDLMIYHCMNKSRPIIHIKRRHSLSCQMQFRRTVIITLTAAIIIQIRIKCIRLHRLLHHQHRQPHHQQPVICQPMAIRLIIIQARIDTGPDSLIQLTKGEKFFEFLFHHFGTPLKYNT